jgi:hypothetical protein
MPRPSTERPSAPRPARAASNARRLAAAAGVGLVFVAWQPGGEPSLVNSVLLPLIGALCAWLVTGSVVAVAAGALMLAAAHADPGAEAILPGVVYPAVAVAAALTLAVLLGGRFRTAMARRRAQRRAEPSPPTQDDD